MYDSNDPRSFYYKRIYNKTKINYKKLIELLIVGLTILLLTFILTKNILLTFFLLIIYNLIILKNILILLIKIYQKVAPISIRSKCRFEPSCSNYMLQSLEKYGLIKGLKKGLNRLKRCNINDGGYDYP